ncbi:MAG: hypothetical protein AAGF77_09145 [Bacteroidota bacterium]
MLVVHQVHKRLEAEQRLNVNDMQSLKSGLEGQMKHLKWYMFWRKRELDESIRALDYLMNTTNGDQEIAKP